MYSPVFPDPQQPATDKLVDVDDIGVASVDVDDIDVASVGVDDIDVASVGVDDVVDDVVAVAVSSGRQGGWCTWH